MSHPLLKAGLLNSTSGVSDGATQKEEREILFPFRRAMRNGLLPRSSEAETTEGRGVLC